MDPHDAPDAPSRSELALNEQALRQDYPTPWPVKKAILQEAINLANPPEGTHVTERTRLRAMQVIALFGRLSLMQQKLDLAREVFEFKAKGGGGAFTLADLVAEAERLAAGHEPDRPPAGHPTAAEE